MESGDMEWKGQPGSRGWESVQTGEAGRDSQKWRTGQAREEWGRHGVTQCGDRDKARGTWLTSQSHHLLQQRLQR